MQQQTLPMVTDQKLICFCKLSTLADRTQTGCGDKDVKLYRQLDAARVESAPSVCNGTSAAETRDASLLLRA